MRLGERVHLLLKKYSRSQKELADFLNTKTSTINGWKQLNRNPSSDMIVPICEFFNISTDYFLKGRDENIYSEVHNSTSDFVLGEEPEKYISKPYRKRISELLKMNNKSIDDLATFLNVSSYTVESWIKGDSAPSCDFIYDICSFFKVDPSFIFNYTQNNSLTEEQVRLLNYFDQLNEFEKNIIIGKISEMIHSKKTRQGTSGEFSEELTPDLSHNINLLDRVNK